MAVCSNTQPTITIQSSSSAWTATDGASVLMFTGNSGTDLISENDSVATVPEIVGTSGSVGVLNLNGTRVFNIYGASPIDLSVGGGGTSLNVQNGYIVKIGVGIMP